MVDIFGFASLSFCDLLVHMKVQPARQSQPYLTLQPWTKLWAKISLFLQFTQCPVLFYQQKEKRLRHPRFRQCWTGSNNVTRIPSLLTHSVVLLGCIAGWSPRVWLCHHIPHLYSSVFQSLKRMHSQQGRSQLPSMLVELRSCANPEPIAVSGEDSGGYED